MDDILLVGEVIEVRGINIKAKVYSDKNTSKLSYNGKLIKNVAVGNYVKILQGYSEIIGVIEGEFIKEINHDKNYSKQTDKINRVLEIKVLGYFNNKNKFIKGIYKMPMISNSIYILKEEEVQNIFCFEDPENNNISIGEISGYDKYRLDLSINKIFSSHIGIFGNTGSGKSNTLTKLYTDLFSKNILGENNHFVFLDFNDEYTKKDILINNKKIYKLSTRSKTGDVYPLDKKVIEDSNFWSIIFDATEKTQKPFLERVIRKYKYHIRNNYTSNLIKELFIAIQEYPNKFINIRSNFIDWLQLVSNNVCKEDEVNINKFIMKIEYHTKNNSLYVNDTLKGKVFFNEFEELKSYIIKDLDSKEFENWSKWDFSNIDLFSIILKYKSIYETLKGYSNDEHIAPMIKRADKRIYEIKKVLDFSDVYNHKKENIEIISISDCNVQMKKIIPLLICKEIYDKQREFKKGTKSLNIIIDEAHNILSDISSRESASWKDYRLEVFEEIIKEGRKFGCFLTISSQRPSDISRTIVSQIHNYFIHRLVNDKDIKAIENSVAFIDRSKQEMIPILSQGQCICSGVAFDFPVIVQVEELEEKLKPDSKDINILSIK